MVYKHITELIGNTPLLLIDPAVHGLKNIDLYAKLEYYNPFGSVKDRIAWGMIKDDIQKIQKEKRTFIEASSGNTAKALQALASIYGLHLEIVTNRFKVLEVKQIVQFIGATFEELPGLSECPDPTVENDVSSVIAKKLSVNPDHYYHASQYTNEKNIKTHYKSTGPEIYADIGNVDYFFGGLGTSGSTRGTAQFLKEKNPQLETIGIVSGSDDFIPGIRSESEMWEVGLFEKEFYDQILIINSKISIEASVNLIRKSGIMGGPTSGAGYAGALEYLSKLDRNLVSRKKAVFIVSDRFEWYMSYYQKRRPDLFGGISKEQINDLSNVAVKELLPLQVEEWLKVPNKLVIDIRTNLGYRMGHVPGSINIPNDTLEEMLSRGLPFPKSTELLFVCPTGELSRKIAARFIDKSYMAVNLSGGITSWRDAGLVMEKTS